MGNSVKANARCLRPLGSSAFSVISVSSSSRILNSKTACVCNTLSLRSCAEILSDTAAASSRTCPFPDSPPFLEPPDVLQLSSGPRDATSLLLILFTHPFFLRDSETCTESMRRHRRRLRSQLMLSLSAERTEGSAVPNWSFLCRSNYAKTSHDQVMHST